MFTKHNSIFQLTKRFEIVQHFKSALEECRDVKSELPNLYRANLKKLTKKSQKKIMIFVVRLHFAMYVLNTLENGPKKWKLDFATFPELREVLSELESDIMMEEKVDEHELSPNKTELVCVAEARDDIVKELDDMKQCIVRVQTILNNISTELQSTIAKTVATMLEEHLKKLSKEESHSD